MVHGLLRRWSQEPSPLCAQLEQWQRNVPRGHPWVWGSYYFICKCPVQKWWETTEDIEWRLGLSTRGKSSPHHVEWHTYLCRTVLLRVPPSTSQRSRTCLPLLTRPGSGTRGPGRLQDNHRKLFHACDKSRLYVVAGRRLQAIRLKGHQQSRLLEIPDPPPSGPLAFVVPLGEEVEGGEKGPPWVKHSRK